MSVLTDAAYNAAWATLTRVENIPNYLTAVSDSHSPAGSAYWNLYNYLRVARGDATVQSSPVTADQRAAVLDSNGDFLPGIRGQVVYWTGQLNSAFPVTATPAPAPIPGPAPGPGSSGMIVAPLVNEPFLGGILDGEIFGIPKKFLLIGLGAYLFLKD